ncbi:protoporphyrinogen oxidase [Alkalicoccobacillus porphyridii]|uniref:Coproporphyrinogen III oxidase n=1 Tax=Alkalicoccobacillus porphyridii TaxID=2597270 RepID=A0A553ZWH0_9BACI|nr:protoporphyrinogen oxidase [Alkalicoccobacillus porphyridii]TSB45773.1 protoporphyrinogen oxidase [Alkalicoccobacillus porphyridii]
MKKKVAIIGGGITGLAAAYELEKANQRGDAEIEYKLIEASNRLGGKIRTHQRDGFIIEAGPDSYLKRKQSMTKLITEVGLDGDLVSNDTGQAYILKERTLYPMPEGAVMGVPTKFTPFATTKLFSPLGKIRALGDLIVPSTIKADEDVSVGYFFRKRLGNEVVDHLIEPLLSGIYGGDMDKLSLKATFPQFQKMVETHQGLMRGFKHTRSKASNQGKKTGMFATLQNGLESLVEAVANELNASSVLLNKNVKKITKKEHSFILTYSNEEEERFDEVIVTTPPPKTAELLGHYPYFNYFKEMTMSSVATVAMVFPENAVHQEQEGTGFVVSRKSEYNITACTWTSKKWRHTTPEGKVILRCYVGKPGHTEIVGQSDETIIQTVLEDLTNVMQIDCEPDFYYVSRWSNPHYQVGHTFRLEKMREDIEMHLPGLYLAGAGLEGVGLPDCIDQGVKAAQSVIS